MTAFKAVAGGGAAGVGVSGIGTLQTGYTWADAAECTVSVQPALPGLCGIGEAGPASHPHRNFTQLETIYDIPCQGVYTVLQGWGTPA